MPEILAIFELPLISYSHSNMIIRTKKNSPATSSPMLTLVTADPTERINKLNMDSNIKFNILNVQNVYPMFDETTVSLCLLLPSYE